MYRFEWYQCLWERRFEILSEARKVREELVGDLRGRVGLYPGSSSCPGPLPRYVLEAIEEANRVPVLPMRRMEDELRCVVKDLFGDDYDAAATNTCEAALRVVFEVLFTPPTMRRGMPTGRGSSPPTARTMNSWLDMADPIRRGIRGYSPIGAAQEVN